MLALGTSDAEVRAHDVDGAIAEARARPDRASRLGVSPASEVPERGHADELERRAAQEGVAVAADAAPERAAEEERHPEGAGEIARVMRAFGVVRLRSVELLERDEIGPSLRADLPDVADGVHAAASDAAMDVVRHDAEARHRARG